MHELAGISVYLVAFHLLFFWNLYSNPFSMATSELLSTFFPTWIWQGREWSKGRIPKYDSCFWLNSHAHPVISTYYPGNCLSLLCVNFFGLDFSFKVYLFEMLIHYLWASIGWFLVLSHYLPPYASLFGAITFTYQAYHIKQQPCIVYTIAWFPWIALCPWLAVSMILLAGYYPLAVYLLPLGLFLNHDFPSWSLGFLLGSIQLVPFIKYLPKTIKSKKQTMEEVGHWETNFYFGLIPIILLVLHPQWSYLWIFLPIISSFFLRNHLPRIYQRAWLLSAYIAIWLSISLIPRSIASLLLIIQCADLWLHNRQIPTRPYCELYKKPSLAFNTSLTRYLEKNLGDSRVSGLPWPLFTGLINNFKTLGYSGGMQLKLMAKWRNDNDPNGSGQHDGFRSNLTDEQLRRHRVAFAYRSSCPDKWMQTEVRHLYKAPYSLS